MEFFLYYMTTDLYVSLVIVIFIAVIFPIIYMEVWVWVSRNFFISSFYYPLAYMVSWTGYCWICHWPCSYGAHYILCYDIIVLSSHFSSIFLFIQFATTVVVKFSVMSFGLFVTLALVLHDRGIELLQKFSLQTISILLLTRHVFCYTEFHLLTSHSLSLV